MKPGKAIIAAIFCSIFLSANSQNTNNISSVFKLLIKQKRGIIVNPQPDTLFISQIKKEIMKDTILMDEAKLYLFDDDIIKDRKMYMIPDHDTIRLSKNEEAHIDSSLSVLKNFRWTKSSLKEIGLSNFILPSISKAKKIIPRKKMVIYSITPPIFIRDNSLCILFYRYRCGELCGYGDLSMLKKIGNKWVYWWNFFFYNA